MRNAPCPSRPVTRGSAFLCAAVAAFLPFVSLPAAAQNRAARAAEPAPGPPADIVFSPSEPSVQPGRRLTVTAKVVDKDGREIPAAAVNFQMPNKADGNFIIAAQSGNTLTVTGFFNEEAPRGGSSPARPPAVPFIVTYAPAGAATPLLTRVLNVALTDGGRPPGPVPPGLKPQVDVMWDVLPGDIVHNSYGRKVQGDFYGIQITIGNNSGYDLQIASAGFTLKRPVKTPSGVSYPLPTATYQLARASLVRQQQVGPRAVLFNSLDALGPVLTGFVPFFHNTNRRTNFSQFINVLTNPFSAGAKLIVPDTTIGHLVRLEQETLRNDNTARTIIPNNTQVSVITFFPKRTLREYMVRELGFDKRDVNEPLKVMEALGDLVLVGQQIQYLNRVRLVGDTEEAETAAISGRILDGCNNPVADVDVKLAGGEFFKETTVKTGADGSYLFQKVPTGEDYRVTPTRDGTAFTSEGGEAFRLEDDHTVNFRVKDETGTVSGTVTDQDGDPLAGVKVKATSKVNGKSKTGETDADGKYTISGLAPDTYTLELTDTEAVKFTGNNKRRETAVLRCAKDVQDFEGEKSEEEETEETEETDGRGGERDAEP